MLSVTLRAMRARPHPKAEEAVIETWGFYCGKCGKWAGRISWFVATDEQGENLYHDPCAPQREEPWIDVHGQPRVRTQPALVPPG